MKAPLPVMNASQPAAGYLQRMMAFVYFLSTIVTAPAEMALRTSFGSQYVHPVVLVLAWLLTNVIAFVSLAGQPVARAAAGTEPRPVGMYTLFLLFTALLLFHIPRIARLMRHMELEPYSESDGNAWGIFRRLPHPTWTMIRVIYEPGAVLAVAVGLYAVRLLEPFAMAYLVVVALMMAAKQSTRLYNDWLRRREVEDMRYLLGLAHRVASGEPLHPRDFMFLPQGMPASADERVKVARSLSPEFAALKSEPVTT